MLTNATLDGLHALRLPGMVRGLVEQREHADYAALSFEERLAMLVDRELTERHNRHLDRALKAARLRFPATVEGIDFRRHRGLERAQVLSLAESHWVDAHHSVVVVGATGLGKTYLACALANAAIRTATARSTCAARACSTTSPSPAPKAAWRVCSPAGPASTFSSSTTS